ncbi:hypothetical protein [Nonomuraea dietziae]|uniref:hypothetical protein n=1 Tax=Nonomuraea dietziae TaxID=65515 RepID=UPI0034175A50
MGVQQKQPGLQPASTGGGNGQGQQLYPAELIATLIGLGATFGPSLVKGILDLFSTQQPGLQPASAGTPQQPGLQPASTGTGNGQGQQLYPAELITTLVGLGITFGPSLVKGILDLFSTQQQSGVQPASAGVADGPGQQMIPADAVSAILDVVHKCGPEVLGTLFDVFSTQQQSGLGPSSTGQGQQMIPADAVSAILDVVFKCGPEVLNSITGLFGTQQQAMQPAMVPSFIPPNFGQECSSSRWPWNIIA